MINLFIASNFSVLVALPKSSVGLKSSLPITLDRIAQIATVEAVNFSTLIAQPVMRKLGAVRFSSLIT